MNTATELATTHAKSDRDRDIRAAAAWLIARGNGNWTLVQRFRDGQTVWTGTNSKGAQVREIVGRK